MIFARLQSLIRCRLCAGITGSVTVILMPLAFCHQLAQLGMGLDNRAGFRVSCWVGSF